ncbi:Protein of unknown function [Bacillus toyonensis]|jgi:allantoinase|eukprot:UN07207
MK